MAAIGAYVFSGRLQFAGPAEMQSFGAALIWLGAFVFLYGLALGDLRQFYWRLAELGRALPRRRRDNPTHLGPPAHRRLPPFKASSPIYAISAGVLALVFALVQVAIIGYIAMYIANSDLERRAGRIDGTTLHLREMKTLLILTLVVVPLLHFGFAYSTYRLSSLWGAMVEAWSVAAASVGKPGAGAPGKWTTPVLRCATLLGACGVAAALYAVCSMCAFQGIVSAYAICVLGEVIMWLLWYGAVLRESRQFTVAMSAFVPPHEKLPPRSVPLLVLLATLVLLVPAELAICLYVFDMLGKSVLFSGLIWCVGGGVHAYVTFWWATMLRDMDFASRCLESAVAADSAESAEETSAQPIGSAAAKR